MKQLLRQSVLPVQILALLIIPMICLMIITLATASFFAILQVASFHDVLTGTSIWVLNFFLFWAFLIATGQMMWDER